MSDRELLEAAARAAGYAPVRWTMGSEWPEGLLLEGIQQPWNPITDDSDALRLAVKLGLQLFADDDPGAERRYALVENGTGAMFMEYWDDHPDQVAAVRTAIVRAAAGIGNKLEKPE